MVSQLSTFTIHPLPKPGCSITEILPDPKYLVRYRIPAERKGDLKSALHAVGISRRTMFQDLESLSGTLIEESSIVGYGPPIPPKC